MERYGTVINAYTANISTGWIKGLTDYQDVMLEYMLSSCLDPHIIKKMTDEMKPLEMKLPGLNRPNCKLQNYTSKILYKNII